MRFVNSVYSFACAPIRVLDVLGKVQKEEIEPIAEPATEGSTYKVPLTTILDITTHPGADRLVVCWVYGFQVIAPKDKFQVGDTVIYIPVDSILPQWLEARLFPAGSKVVLHNSRVRQIKLRGLASQGMLISMDDIQSDLQKLSGKLVLEKNYAQWLDIKKYEPPAPKLQGTSLGKRQRGKKTDHPLFHKYNGLDNVKWFPDLFKEGEEVVLQEKLHGTNARASLLPFQANTLFKKLKLLLGLAPEFEKCYGSNNVEISAATTYKGYYGLDVYGACFSKLNVFEKLRPGETVFGEIIGPSIQKNYTYGLKEHVFVLFDVKVLLPNGKQKWLTPDEAAQFAFDRGFEFVPTLYKGPFNKEQAYKLTFGNSEYGDKKQKVREGIVIKARSDYDTEGNKRALKWVSEDYLADFSNSDNH